MSTQTITVYPTSTGWYADFSQHSYGATVRAAFGASCIPLPFTTAARAEDVIAAQRKLWPGSIIRLELAS